jgi:L-amino acid N-acyltransferase YncA
MKIRTFQRGDEVNIARLYNTFIENSITTFETKSISDEEMLGRIENISNTYPYLVAEVENKFAGYAYATQWKPREAYFATVESTIYMHPDFIGKGRGFALYTELLNQLKESGIHAVIGGIALPNVASIDLHLKCGFEYLGTFKEVGYKLNKWVDVSYFQKLF